MGKSFKRNISKSLGLKTYYKKKRISSGNYDIKIIEGLIQEDSQPQKVQIKEKVSKSSLLFSNTVKILESINNKKDYIDSNCHYNISIMIREYIHGLDESICPKKLLEPQLIENIYKITQILRMNEIELAQFTFILDKLANEKTNVWEKENLFWFGFYCKAKFSSLYQKIYIKGNLEKYEQIEKFNFVLFDIKILHSRIIKLLKINYQNNSSESSNSIDYDKLANFMCENNKKFFNIFNTINSKNPAISKETFINIKDQKTTKEKTNDILFKENEGKNNVLFDEEIKMIDNNNNLIQNDSELNLNEDNKSNNNEDLDNSINIFEDIFKSIIEDFDTYKCLSLPFKSSSI